MFSSATTARDGAGNASVDELVDRSVLDVVVRLPKTLAPGTTVAEARAALADDHVHMLLITDAGKLLGTVVRADLPQTGRVSAIALGYARLEGRTIGSDVNAEAARRLLLGRGERRAAVIDDDGVLLGLLCLKRRLTGFCSDAEVEERAAAPACGP